MPLREKLLKVYKILVKKLCNNVSQAGPLWLVRRISLNSIKMRLSRNIDKDTLTEIGAVNKKNEKACNLKWRRLPGTFDFLMYALFSNR